MGQDLLHNSKMLTQSKKPFKHELGGGEYWENEALRAKIDGFGTRYNGDHVNGRDKNGAERPYAARAGFCAFTPKCHTLSMISQ